MSPRGPKGAGKPTATAGQPGAESGEEPRELGLKNAGLRPALADRIDRFIVKHPELGINYRNEFANRACEDYLARMERKLLVSKALESVEEGRLSPVEALRKIGVNLNAED